MDPCVVGNFVTQIFAWLILPILLPIVLLSVLLGMRTEKLFEEVLGLAEAIFGSLLKSVFLMLKVSVKGIAELVERQLKAKTSSASTGYPKKKAGDETLLPGKKQMQG